jgi:hypothetical protein
MASKFDEVVKDGTDNRNDEIAVSLYAHFILNTSPGYRPSDAARRAVREFQENPDRIRNRVSGQAP